MRVEDTKYPKLFKESGLMLEGSPIRGHSDEGIVKIFERKN